MSGQGRGVEPHLANVLTHVFDDHLVSGNGFHGKQSPLMDPAPAKSKLLLPELEGRRQTVPLGIPFNPATGHSSDLRARSALATRARTTPGVSVMPPSHSAPALLSSHSSLTLSWFNFSRSLSMMAEVPMALSSRRCSDRRSESTRLVPYEEQAREEVK